MTKTEIIKLLESFDDDATLASDGRLVNLHNLTAVCGKEDTGFGYTCCLPVGHTSDCWDTNKDVDFEPYP